MPPNHCEMSFLPPQLLPSLERQVQPLKPPAVIHAPPPQPTSRMRYWSSALSPGTSATSLVQVSPLSEERMRRPPYPTARKVPGRVARSGGAARVARSAPGTPPSAGAAPSPKASPPVAPGCISVEHADHAPSANTNTIDRVISHIQDPTPPGRLTEPCSCRGKGATISSSAPPAPR